MSLSSGILVFLLAQEFSARDARIVGELANTYEYYGLPLPNRDAELQAGWQYWPRNGHVGDLRTVFSNMQFVREMSQGPLEITDLNKLSIESRKHYIPLVAIEAALGRTTRAVEILSQIKAHEQVESREIYSLGRQVTLADNIEFEDSAAGWLADEALHYWAGQLYDPLANRAKIARYFRRIIASFPTQTKPSLRRAIDSIGAPKPHSRSRMNALIDRLCDSPSDYTFELYRTMPERPNAVLDILDQGFDIVPTLIEHMDDRRMTVARHATNRDYFDWPALPVSVGEVCTLILESFAPDERFAHFDIAIRDKNHHHADRPLCNLSLSTSFSINQLPASKALRKSAPIETGGRGRISVPNGFFRFGGGQSTFASTFVSGDKTQARNWFEGARRRGELATLSNAEAMTRSNLPFYTLSRRHPRAIYDVFRQIVADRTQTLPRSLSSFEWSPFTDNTILARIRREEEAKQRPIP